MAKQPETKVKFSIFNKEFNEGIGEMSKESTKLRKEFKLQSEQMKDTATATEKLEAKISHLGKEQGIVKQKIKATDDQLEKAKKTYGKNSDEANKLSNKLLDLKIAEQKLENAIGQSRQEINKQAQAMSEAKQDADKYKKALDDVGSKANDAGDKLTTGLSAPIAGIGAIAGASALSMGGAMQLVIGSLGATGEEAEQLKTDMQEVWESGFGDNPETVARAMTMVKQNIQGINDGEPLQKATKNMLVLADVTEADMSEATRGVNQLMHNFGLTAQEAMDLFVKGQQEGINYSNEMFDNISEYAPLFKDMGFSAEEYFSILANGTKNGAYNLDYINDLMKEFNIRVQDGSDKTADAFGEMSKETQDMFKEFENGKITTEELFDSVIPELEKMEDQTKANQIMIELFGTKAEDMGSDTVYALDDVNDSMKDVDGSMKDLAKSQEEAFGIKFKKTIRGVTKALLPLGTELLEIAEDATPKIKELSEWFANLSGESQALLGKTLLVTAAIGPLLKVFGGLIGIVSKLTGGLGGKGLGGTILRLVAKAGPVGLAIAAIGGLGIVVGTLISKKDELKDVSLETANAMLKEHESTKIMIDQFEKLRKKSKLTTDEFGRFLDLQTELESATNPEAIAAIKDEMNGLQKKSGMSNDELLKMVGYNQDLVETLPGATEIITTQGNKVAGTTDEMRKYNQEIAKMALMELENEFNKALINQQELLKTRNGLEKEHQAGLEIQKIIGDVLKQNSSKALENKRNQLKTEREQILASIAEKQLSGENYDLDRLKLQKNKEILDKLKGSRDEVYKTWGKLVDQNEEKQKAITKTDTELAKLGQVYQKLQLNYLKNAGITEEKARQAVKDGTAIDMIKLKLGKLAAEKQALIDQTPVNERNTDEYRKQIGKIDDQIDKLNSAKGDIKDLTGQAGKYTDELGKDVDKTANVKVDPSVSWLDKQLEETVYKTLSISTIGLGATENFMKSSLGIPFNADGTNFHPGGPSWVGEEGPELVKQGNKLSLQSFGIMPDLESGAQVFTAEQTKKILSGMNQLPAYASGVGVSDAMARNINITGQNLASRQESMTNRLTVSIEASDVIMDGRAVGSITWKPIKEFIDREEGRNGRF